MTVLVLGASGLVGSAAVDAFAAHGSRVIAVSRRPLDHQASNVVAAPADLSNPVMCAELVAGLPPITRVVYAAVHEMPTLVRGWRSSEQMDTNLAMLQNILDPLAFAHRLEHVTLLQGTKAYGVHLHPIRLPARENEPRDDHANFYWLHEDHLRASAERHGFAWTILRPPLVVGPRTGVAMNLPPVLGAYAALRAAENLPFSFPGGPSYVADAVDARIVAQACVWAAQADSARFRHFNITNGDVYQWRDMWPTIAEALGVEVGPDEPRRLREYFEDKERLWAQIVGERGLVDHTLTHLLGTSAEYADFQLIPGADAPPPPALLSTVEIRRAGFTPAMHTIDSFVDAIVTLQKNSHLPRMM